MYIWTRKEIEYILLQLEEKGYPFENYRFSRKDNGLSLLGTGGFACVYAAENRRKDKRKYAIKVIGFGDKHVDSETFKSCVSAQKNIGNFRDNIIKIYEYSELDVRLDESSCVISVGLESENKSGKNQLKLQFILMEQCEPIVTYNKAGRIRPVCDKLKAFDEQEVLKLAYDIGKALTFAHNQNVIHRDVKLENIFYDAGKGVYKLGDFGIAKVTNDGMASTIAFTKGYGAPELVESIEDRYDNTADIYSFGILLYLLLNDLKFPDSDSYRSNSKMQYSQGYVLPKPQNGSDKLTDIIRRMCMYDPDARYQTANEMLDELEGLYFSQEYHYKKQHRSAALIVGTVFLLAGTIALKLTILPELSLELNVWMYIFLGLAFVKAGLEVLKKNLTIVSTLLLILGIPLLIVSGFAWWKLLLLLCIVFASGAFAGQAAGVILLINIMTLIDGTIFKLEQYADYRWIAPTLLSLGAILNFQVSALKERDRKVLPHYFKKNIFWIAVGVFYIALILHGWTFGADNSFITKLIPHTEFMREITVVCDLSKVGIAGLIFTILWNGREMMLQYWEKRKNNKI